jgi:hypothetical protein
VLAAGSRHAVARIEPSGDDLRLQEAPDPSKPQFRETFRYRTDIGDAAQNRSSFEAAAQRLGVTLVAVNELPVRRGVKLEIVAEGDSRSLNRLRENFNGITVFTDSGGSLSDPVIGPPMDATATRLRRVWWALQRRRSGPIDR